MKTIHCVVLLAVLVLSGCSHRPHGPCAELAGSDRVDFGKYPAWEKRIAEFSIRNAGDKALDILSIKKTCGCAVVTCSRKRLGPGEDAVVRVLILPDSIFGEYDKPTFIETSDPARRVIPLHVSGNAMPPVVVKPSAYLYFGRIKTNEEWRQTFDLTPTLKGVRLGVPETRSDVLVKVDLKPHNGVGVRSELAVVLPPVTNSGDFSCSIRIPIVAPPNHPPLEIGIAGKIGAELVALPGMFRVPRSETAIRRQFTLRIVGRTAKDMDVGALQFPKCAGLECFVDSIGRKNIITVEMSAGPAFVDQLRSDGKITALICLPEVAPAKLVFESVETGAVADQ